MKLPELGTSFALGLTIAALTLGLGLTVYGAIQADRAKKAAAVELEKKAPRWSGDHEKQMGKEWVDSFNR